MPKKIVFDIDETITKKAGADYTIDSLPNQPMIDCINALHKLGYYIILHTARKMESSGGNIGKALAAGGYNTFKWLEKHKVTFDEIVFGKPNGDIYIDDKAFGYNESDVLSHLNDLIKSENLIQGNPIPFEVKKEEGRLSILRLIDAWNWAYDHISREQAKYSTYNITSERLQDMTIDKLKGIDILYIPGPNMGYAPLREKLIAHARSMNPKIKVVCGYAGEHDMMYPNADIIVSISAKFYPRLKEMYNARKIPVVFLPESADTQFFVPAAVYPKEFTVGWAGRVAEVKRCHLLDKLIFPIQRQSEHGKEFFKTPNRSLQPMKAFYHGLSCLVLTSSTEAMPRVVLEAMACGLPVISTDVGSIRMLLDPEWIVPVNPEATVVAEMNKKLNLLKNNPVLAEEVGDRNRKFVEEFFSWKVNQPMWDAFFEEVAKGHFISAEIYNKEYRKKYGQFESALLK